MNLRSSLRALAKTATALIIAALALAVAGCGGGSDGSSSTGVGTEGAAQTANPPSETGSSSEPSQGSGSEGEAGETSEAEGESSSSGAAPESKADDSIQTFGSEAEGEEKEAVEAAAHAFFKAFASGDYAAVCSGLISDYRKQLQAYIKQKPQLGHSCAQVLAKVLPSQAAEAKKAVTASIIKVRTGEGKALVLFKPAGEPIRYFAMKLDGGRWRSVSLSTGTPLVATPSTP